MQESVLKHVLCILWVMAGAVDKIYYIQIYQQEQMVTKKYN